MNNSTENTFSILINTCYGGFGLSEKAVELYTNRKKEIDPLFEYKEYSIKRDDPILIQIFHELGDEINNGYSKLTIRNIDSRYKKCYRIHKYDGKESIELLNNKYKLFAINEILNNDQLNSDEKINEIKKIE